MKVLSSMAVSMLLVYGGLNAQLTTNYGQYSGSAGDYNVNLGYRTGNSAPATNNVAVGAFAMRYQDGSLSSVGIGYQSLYRNEASGNVGVGYRTLFYTTTGERNVAIGTGTLSQNTTGDHNIGMGYEAVSAVTTGGYNVGIGGYALDRTTSSYNSALGYFALGLNTSGQKNTALGYLSSRSNSTGSYNTSVGTESAYKATTASNNTSVGYQALYDNTTGYNNTSIGTYSMENNISGGFQTAVGYYALRNVTGGFYNTAFGSYSGPSSSGSYQNTLSLGFGAAAISNNTTRIGNTSMTSIGGYANWSNVSDGRFKSEVQEDVMGLEFVNALRPVSYQLDRKKIHQFVHEGNKELEGLANLAEAEYQTGFIAQEVEATAKALGFDHFNGVDAPKNEHDHYGLRYAEFVVPLVKSVQELSAQNEAQTQTIEELKALVEQQQVQIEQLLNNSSTSTREPVSSSAQLHQNIPNPHQGQTQIKVFIPESSQEAFLQVTDLSGKQLMVQNIPTVGEQNIMLITKDLEAGMYLYTLVVDQEIVATKKMVVAQ